MEIQDVCYFVRLRKAGLPNKKHYHIIELAHKLFKLTTTPCKHSLQGVFCEAANRDLTAFFKLMLTQIGLQASPIR